MISEKYYSENQAAIELNVDDLHGICATIKATALRIRPEDGDANNREWDALIERLSKASDKINNEINELKKSRQRYVVTRTSYSGDVEYCGQYTLKLLDGWTKNRCEADVYYSKFNANDTKWQCSDKYNNSECEDYIGYDFDVEVVPAGEEL
jgi:hypothetical protein